MAIFSLDDTMLKITMALADTDIYEAIKKQKLQAIY